MLINTLNCRSSVLISCLKLYELDTFMFSYSLVTSFSQASSTALFMARLVGQFTTLVWNEIFQKLLDGSLKFVQTFMVPSS